MSRQRYNEWSPFSTPGVAIGGAPTEVRAILDLKSTTMGLLIPRLTTVQRNAIASPPDGLMVYDVDLHAIVHYSTGTNSWESSDGVQSINGMTAKLQLLTTGAGGTAPNWTQSGGNTNVLNVPLASGVGVTSGTISNSNFDSFNSRLFPQQNVRYVVKNSVLGPQDYNSIQAAIDSITDASASNPYIVKGGPGRFVGAVVMKPWVWFQGSEQDQTIIESDAPNKHAVTGADNAGVSRCLIQGATDPGFAGVYYKSLVGTTNTSFFAEDVRFGHNDTLGIADGSVASTAIFLENCKIGGTHQFNHGFLGVSGGRIVGRNGTTTGLTAPYPDYVFKGTGAGSQIVLNGFQIRSGGITSGACVHLSDGATLRALSANIRMFGKALWIENAGAASVVDAVGILCEGNTMDIVVDHPGADGTFNGSADHNKIYVNPASGFSVVISCNSQPTDGTGSVTVGTILQGDRFDRLANLSKIARTATTLGVDEVEEQDFIEDLGGLNIRVLTGTGFLNDPTDFYLKEIFWSQTDLVLAANSTYYIFVDTNGTVQASPSAPDLQTTIVLGRVNTNGTGVRFIENSDLPLNHYGNKTEYFFRNVLGPVFQSGAKVTESLSNARRLDVTAGLYSYGVSPFALAGGSEIQWELFYHSAPGVFTSVAGQNTLSNTQYDNGSGPTSLTAGWYTKHHLYALGGDSVDRWFVVMGHEQYETLGEAKDGGLPPLPSFMTNAVTRVAAIIVQQGATNIVGDVLDIRPRIGFAAPSGTAVTRLGDLSGLDEDVLLQYLPVNGSRAMTGPLNMGGQAITNVGLVDGVDVSAHAARHLPNGADPIATAAPSADLSATTTNSEGSSNSLARSGHGHAILTGPPSTILPDQANTTGSGAEIARAGHGHNVPTAAAVEITDATNSQGVGAAFARNDHGHAHGNRGGGTLHAAATTSVAGFMSAPDKVRVDGIESLADGRITLQKGAANGLATLDGGGKIPVAQLPSSVMEFKGLWNASTNSPTLADGVGDSGDTYRVSVAGTQNLGSGSQTFEVGDLVIYDGTAWRRCDTTDAVTSVNSKTGTVILVTGDIAEGGGNLWYTDERVDDRVAALIQNGTGISWTYNDAGNTLTPAVTLSAFSTTNLAEGTNLYYTTARFDSAFAGKSTTNLAEGTNLYYTDARARAALSGTAPIGYNSGTGAISISAATTSAAGSMSAADKTKLDALNVELFADQLDSPNNSDWAVNALAPAIADPAAASLTVRRFNDAVITGVGFNLTVPAWATSMVIAIKGRSQAAAGSTLAVVMGLYTRNIPSNAARGAWSSITNLTALSVPNNANTQYFAAQTVSLATIGATAGNRTQFELVRVGTNGGDTLTQNFLMDSVSISFV